MNKRVIKICAVKVLRKLFAMIVLAVISFGVLVALLMGAGALYYRLCSEPNQVAATECTQYFLCIGIPMVACYVSLVTTIDLDGDSNWMYKWLNY